MIKNIILYIFADHLAEKYSEIREDITRELKTLIEDKCLSIVEEMFFNGDDSTKTFRYYPRIIDRDTMTGIIKKHVVKSVYGKFNDDYKQEALKYVAGEEFIDQVVERINNKQLK